MTKVRLQPARNEGGKALPALGVPDFSWVEFRWGWAVQVGGATLLSVALLGGTGEGAWPGWVRQDSRVPVGWPESSSSRYTA